LGVGKDYGDDMACCLEVLNEGMNVRGGLVGGRTVVIYYLSIGLAPNGFLMTRRLIGLTRMCILACVK
jgi:hypothetical protein